MSRTRVRISILHDRRTEAERELCEYALKVGAGRPCIQGTDLLFDFTGVDQMEKAQGFAVNARNTPGCFVYGPQQMSYAGREVER